VLPQTRRRGPAAISLNGIDTFYYINFVPKCASKLSGLTNFFNRSKLNIDTYTCCPDVLFEALPSVTNSLRPWRCFILGNFFIRSPNYPLISNNSTPEISGGYVTIPARDCNLRAFQLALRLTVSQILAILSSFVNPIARYCCNFR